MKSKHKGKKGDAHTKKGVRSCNTTFHHRERENNDSHRRSGEVDEAILYGSRAKGCHKPDSDIDITLTGDTLTLKELNCISLALDELLLPYTFDLSIYQNIDDPDLLAHIRRVGKMLYRKKGK